MRISIYRRSDNKKKLTIDLKLNNFRVNRQINIPKSQIQTFKSALKTFLIKKFATITSQDKLKEIFAEFYKNFTGQNLPERPKHKPYFEKLKKEKSIPGTLCWLLKLYLEHTKHKHAPKTFECHLRAYSHIRKSLNSIPISDLNSAYLLEYQAQRKTQNASNRTVNMEIGLIRKALNWALDMGLIESHNVKKFPMLPESKRLHAYLTEEELQKLVSVLKTQNPLLAYRVLFNVLTGLRPKEIATLEWTDIDFENRILFVRKKAENQIKDREERTVPLCELALNILHQVKNLNPHGKYVFSCKEKPVFNIKSQLKRAARKANLSKSVFPYMLRHTFATLFLKNGGSIYDLKVILGHSDISTTEKYLHTTASYLKNGIERLNCLSSVIK